MGLRKCPRCELNYIRDDEKYCNVCKREMKGEPDAEESVLMCIECGENPAVRGSELCAICLREARRQEKLSNLPEDIRSHGELSLTSVALDEIEVPEGHRVERSGIDGFGFHITAADASSCP